MTQVTIVHGPMGCGKTFNKHKIAKRLGCDVIIDGVDASSAGLGQLRGRHALVLTYDLDGAKRHFRGARTVGFASLGFPMWNRAR